MVKVGGGSIAQPPGSSVTSRVATQPYLFEHGGMLLCGGASAPPPALRFGHPGLEDDLAGRTSLFHHPVRVRCSAQRKDVTDRDVYPTRRDEADQRRQGVDRDLRADCTMVDGMAGFVDAPWVFP